MIENYRIMIPLQKIPSINTAHQIGRSGSKVWMYLHPDVKKMQDIIRMNLLKNNSKEWSEKYKEGYVLHLDIIYVLRDNFWKRDTSNLTKHVEDAIAQTIDINDANNMKVSAEKVLNDIDENEYIVLILKPILKDDSLVYKWSQF